MGEIRIHFQEILSHGHFIKGDYQLVCHGKIISKNKVKILSDFHFHHALQCSITSAYPSSVILITPLQEWTSINIRVCYKNNHWDIKLVVDLTNRRIFIENQDPIPPFMLSRILSSFGLKNRKRILYLSSHIGIHNNKSHLNIENN
ncbi:hypothetical protein ACQKP0_04070 [Heyndrickxia sp. NPDC080065]|uniref:hypothetical protein n=1 Tax=Heyndrickxia sp. NPDC080065 TaxID=3390568 RepID=UPI003CFEB825